MADAGNVSHWKMELSQPLVTIETVVLISVVKLAVLGVKYSRTIFLVCVERGVVNYTNPPRPCAPMPVTHLQKAPAKCQCKGGDSNLQKTTSAASLRTRRQRECAACLRYSDVTLERRTCKNKCESLNSVPQISRGCRRRVQILFSRL